MNGTLRVRLVEGAADWERWDAFVNLLPAATFFHRSGWGRAIETALGHRAYGFVAERGGAIEGVLPLVHIKSRLFGNSLISNAFAVHGGPAAETAEARAVLDEAAISLAGTLGVDYLEYRSQECPNPAWLCKENVYVAFQKEILPKVEDNLLAIPRKQRAVIRKAIKRGLVSVLDRDVDRLYAVYAESVHNLGTPVFPKRLFEALKQEFAEDCQIMLVLQGDTALAAVMSFRFRDRILPYYGGGTQACRAVGGNDFMYWEVMRRACEDGLKVFDFGRSKIGTGSHDFKKHWGFEPLPMPYSYYLNRASEMPDVNPNNPKYRILVKAWQRAPLRLCNLIGPMIARNLG